MSTPQKQLDKEVEKAEKALSHSSPCCQDQIIDAELRGYLRGLQKAMEIMYGRS